MCKVGGEIYNIYERPPKSDLRCDNDGGQLEQRPDDREEIVGPRLQAYERQTEPLWRITAGWDACTGERREKRRRSEAASA